MDHIERSLRKAHGMKLPLERPVFLEIKARFRVFFLFFGMSFQVEEKRINTWLTLVKKEYEKRK